MSETRRAARKVQSPSPSRAVRRVGAYESERFYTNRLSLLNRLIARTTKQMLAEQFSLSQMEWRVLIQLEYRSPSKISEMHDRSLVPKPQISSVLPHLIRKNYVVRIDDPADARAPYFAVTEEGLSVYRAVIRVSRKRQRKLELLLSQHDRAAFDSAIDHLIAYFKAQASFDARGVFEGAGIPNVALPANPNSRHSRAF